jgi:hypothetical protein
MFIRNAHAQKKKKKKQLHSFFSSRLPKYITTFYVMSNSFSQYHIRSLKILVKLSTNRFLFSVHETNKCYAIWNFQRKTGPPNVYIMLSCTYSIFFTSCPAMRLNWAKPTKQFEKEWKQYLTLHYFSWQQTV